MAYLQNALILASILIAGCYLWEIAGLLYARTYSKEPNKLRGAIAAANRASLVTHESLETMNSVAQLRADGLTHKKKVALPPYGGVRPLQDLVDGLRPMKSRLMNAISLLSLLDSPETCSTSSYEFILSPQLAQQKVPDTPSPAALDENEQVKADISEYKFVLLQLRTAMRGSQHSDLLNAVKTLCLEDTMPQMLLLSELQRPLLDFWADAIYFLADKLQSAVYLAILHVLLRPSDLLLRTLDPVDREYVLSVALNKVNHFPRCFPVILLWLQCNIQENCLHYTLFILCLNSQIGDKLHDQCDNIFSYYFNQEPNGNQFALAVALSRYLRLVPLG